MNKKMKNNYRLFQSSSHFFDNLVYAKFIERPKFGSSVKHHLDRDTDMHLFALECSTQGKVTENKPGEGSVRVHLNYLGN